ncbi:integral membrane sensor signal transduction histidine kinase [Bifidobacterium sp. DSM 109959]|uniref:histidine kinase n=2 Tax=Bifidobacterium olomucense TaxID=2675324 RepID=A0A7Y0EWZ5_9BIFI|nr:integral membrane sensor signal transduction histidine kinase [Bifidobacterium sp. DSM 109959]
MKPWIRSETIRMVLFDALLAVLLISFSPLMATSTDPATNPGLLFPSSQLATALWSLPNALPLTLRRVRPEIAAWLFVGLTVVHLFVGPAIIYSDFLALVMLYSVLVYGDARHTVRFVVTSLTMSLLAGAVWGVTFNIGSLFGSAAGFDITWTAWLPTAATLPVCPGGNGIVPDAGNCGMKILEDSLIMAAAIAASAISIVVMALWQRARRATIAAMRQRNAAIEARDVEEARIAALAERARIARDMHDVVAHTLSTIIVQADGGRYAGAQNVDLARSTMGTIRHEAVRAQHDMQRVFSVFGTQTDATADGNAIAYDDIPSLLNSTTNVSRTITGHVQPDRLSPQASEAVFRLVQEALTNVRRYAGTGAQVSIIEHWSDSALSVTVTDDGIGAKSALDGHRPGYGLIGMRERITALGGTVSAGPQHERGFQVSASIPLLSAHDPAPAEVYGTLPPRTDNLPISASLPKIDESRTVVPSILPIWTRVRTRLTVASRRVVRCCVTRLPALFRSKHFEQGGSAHRFDWIGRLAQWTERHYLLMDMLTAAALMLLLNSTTYNDLRLLAADGIHWMLPDRTFTTALTIALLAPLAFRRRFPETSALSMAVVSFIQLLLPSSIMPANGLFVNMFALVSVYSAVLYGRERAWRWVCMAMAIDSWTFGVKMAAGWNGTDLWHIVAQLIIPGRNAPAAWTVILHGLVPAGMVMVIGFACIAAARWTRSRGANALVLQQREEALRAEQERQKVLAANLERERIGAAIQAEVMTTLESVIMQTDDGLAMLNASPTPESTQIANSFAAIGTRGRAALAHMRELLRVLRETGFSDEQHKGMQPQMQLAPATSLDSQMHTAKRSA